MSRRLISPDHNLTESAREPSAFLGIRTDLSQSACSWVRLREGSVGWPSDTLVHKSCHSVSSSLVCKQWDSLMTIGRKRFNSLNEKIIESKGLCLLIWSLGEKEYCGRIQDVIINMRELLMPLAEYVLDYRDTCVEGLEL